MIREKVKNLFFESFPFLLIVIMVFFTFDVNLVLASDNQIPSLVNKIAKDYTKKFCNSIAFGLSKESAMNFSTSENKKVFKNRKGIDKIDKDLIAEEIARSVVYSCGYPIGMSGEKGVLDFKNFYLSKDKNS